MILGIYAILVGLRLVLIKPKMVSSGKITPAMGFVSLVFSILTGLISALVSLVIIGITSYYRSKAKKLDAATNSAS